MRNFLGAGLILLAVGSTGTMAPAQGDDRHFDAERNALCAAGQKLGAGCDAIRARPIVDATVPPWRGIGRVNFASIQVRSHCTGALVAPQVVLTAAHCLYNHARKSWIPAQSIQFVAGYQRGAYSALAQVERYVLGPGHADRDAPFNRDLTQDWAFLVLTAPLDAGILAIDDTPPEALIGADIGVVGYPGLRPHVLSVSRDCALAPMDRLPEMIVTDCAAMNGDSGAPLVRFDGDRIAILGVVAAVTDPGTGLLTLIAPVGLWSAALETLLETHALP